MQVKSIIHETDYWRAGRNGDTLTVKMIKLRPGALERLRGNTTQAALARKAGVARITIIRIENDEPDSVTFDTVNRIAKALGVDADMLVTFK